ncbi:MAG: stage II sporulation protein M [Thaumarchaeota archaeon]|jgi:hypothetical protein|nr:stage II sporulation protein M [Candidatus Geocrenenecus arthurdayi]
MKSYTLALMVSVGVFLAGLSAGYILVYLFNLNPRTLLETVLETAPAKATVARAEAVSQAVKNVIETFTPQLKKYILHQDAVEYVSSALGIFSTNTVTAFGAAVTPLLPVLWQRKITPWFMKLTRKRYDPEVSWRSYYRYAVPLPPVMILGFNGFIVSLVASIAGFIDFMAPEIAGITCLAAVGMKAALNWKTPESVESSYSSLWNVSFYSVLFLMVGAFMEARLIV